MLTREQNDLLTQTGPGTPMGNLFRRYWIPALLAEEVAEADCDPVRVKLLGEELIAFRDTEGRLGVIDEFCAHRTASLFFGRNEECGLRCGYHGWKYDVDGNCVDMPSEPEGTRFREKIKLRAYKAVEAGGLIWLYMGDPDKEPALPNLEWMGLNPEKRFISKRRQFSNYLQAMEGGIDSSHVSFAHRFNLDADPMHAGTEGNKYLKADTRPKFEVAESDGGLLIGARRNAEEGHYYWRVTPWVMPSFTLVPPRGDHPIHGHFWIPIDDENCWVFSFDYHTVRPLTTEERQAMKDGHGVHNEYVPGTYRPLQNKDNDYLMDRAAQKRGDTYSGIKGIAMQDASLQESMGPIVDRTKEKLVSTDSGIIMARQKLWKAVEALRDEGVRPPGVDTTHQRVRSAAVVLPKEEAFIDASREALTVQPGTRHASV
jgi:phthalate 4,5-dioxygenase